MSERSQSTSTSTSKSTSSTSTPTTSQALTRSSSSSSSSSSLASLTAPTSTNPPYAGPAAGPMAVLSSFRYASRTSGLRRGLHVFLNVNQADGFDCPGCAWPDPAGHRAAFEFCENGARAVAHEADIRRADAAFFQRHSIAELRTHTDHWLEHQGRLVEPLIKRPGDSHYSAVSWDEAFRVVGETMKTLASPDEAVFYTSGRTSNEAAFLYQLFARAFGTNNMPDCSNMCHESSGKGLGTTIGVGKGTVQLDDFACAEMILVIGQNPGTNHPRMLSTLAAARARGATIVVVNPLRERALESFAHPQKGLGMVGVGSPIATHWAQVKVNGDVAFLKGLMKVVVENDALDRAFLDAHCAGVDDVLADLAQTSWTDIEAQTGLPRAHIEEIGRLYARAQSAIACWAMGITQHENGVDNVRAIVNLLLLRGNMGKPGAGACPVRGHSNVQGDRTMGILETPHEPFLAALDAATGIRSPRSHGADVVHAIEAFEAGAARVFIGMGGNLVAAAPDTDRVDAGLQKATLTVSVATKLNRTHLACGATSLVLPCLGRSEVDQTGGKRQFVTVENSMSVVHKTEGKLAPASTLLRSEVAIVCGMAEATLGDLPAVRWAALADNYDSVRDLIARVVPGFEDFNARVRAPDGFVLRNTAREREWKTSTSKANLTVTPLPQWDLADDELLLMTVRSHDQFNTTVYEENDRYRGIYGRRDIIFVNAADLAARGLKDGDRVDIVGRTVGGRVRRKDGFTAVAFDLPRGAVCGYFPELNALVPLEQRARESHTPASKSVVVRIVAAGVP